MGPRIPITSLLMERLYRASLTLQVLRLRLNNLSSLFNWLRPFSAFRRMDSLDRHRVHRLPSQHSLVPSLDRPILWPRPQFPHLLLILLSRQ